MKHIISTKNVSLSDLSEIIYHVKNLELSDDSKALIKQSRDYLDKNFGEKGSRTAYGINTGFGSLCDTRIEAEDLEDLQHNLIKSHACGTGNKVPQEIVKLMIFLKIQTLSYGYSGVSVKLVERLIYFYNHDIIPVVYEQGSLGASGDLAPLAHLALPIIGLGEVCYKGKFISAKELYELIDLNPLKLKSKEGLALINGTQFMLAYGIFNLLESYKATYWAHISAALAVDGFDASKSPFDSKLHLIRAHKGQLKSALMMEELLVDSEIAANIKENVQDPYSFRCVPQVHGATFDTLHFVKRTFITEVNSVTDNPNIFSDSETIISGGNFHGQPLALALDFLAIAMSEIANISERRTFQLLSGKRGLPSFLAKKPGLHSGLMIVQYTAASIVSQNKQLATPASVDSIVSSNGQEDHVSMGANSATKCYKVLNNVITVLGIEMITAIEALEYREHQTSSFLQNIITLFRAQVPKLEEDRVLHDDIIEAKRFITEMMIEDDILFK
ncbi:MAG: histidine ammonia-lyase [Nonlabens sp.]